MSEVVARVGIEATATGVDGVVRSLDQLTNAGVKSEKALKEAAKATKLTANELTNLSFQANDVITSLASGGKPLQVLAQQGGQVAQTFQLAAARGVGLGDALKSIGATVAPFAPLAVAVGAVAGAFLLWKKAVEDAKAAVLATTKASADFIKVQDQTRDALSGALDFATKYKVANNDLAKALDGVILSQDAGYQATLNTISGHDAAGQAAIRRAELEKLLTVSVLKRAAAEATARAAESDKAVGAAKKSAFNAGAIAAFGLGDLSLAAEAKSQEFKKLGGETAAKAAAQEREYAKALNASAEALQKATLTIPEHVKAHKERTKAVKEAKDVTASFDNEAQSFLKSLQDETRALNGTAESTKRYKADVAELLAIAGGNNDLAEQIERQYEAWAKAHREVEGLKNAVSEYKKTLQELERINDQRDRGGENADTRTEIEKVADAWDKVGRSADDAFDAIGRNDWVGALRAIAQTMEAVKKAFAEGASSADKFTAAASVVSSIGNAVGGKAGATLSGAASGAAAGFVLGGPIGAGIGAVVGGLGGLLGASKAQKQAKAQAAAQLAADRASLEVALLQAQGDALGALNRQRAYELSTTDASLRAMKEQLFAAQDAAEAEAKAANLAQQRHELEIQLMEVSGDAVGALAARRQDELAGIDDSLKAIAQQIYAQQDLAAAQQAAAQAANDAAAAARQMAADVKASNDNIFGLANQRAQLQARLLTARGDTAGATAISRQLELQGLDPSLRGLQSDVYQAEDLTAKRDELSAAYDRESSALEAVRDKFQNFFDTLKAYTTDLARTAAEALGPRGRTAAARRALARVSAGVAGGDEASFGLLQGAGSELISASRASSASSRAYLKDIAAVRRAVEAAQGAAKTQISTAQRQLDALNESVRGIFAVNDNVKSVAELLREYLTAKNSGGGAAPAGSIFSGAGFNYGSIAGSYGGVSLAEIIQSGNVNGFAGIGGGFATGGTIRGPSSGDRVPMLAMVNGGESVSISRSDNIARMAKAQEDANRLAAEQNRLLAKLVRSNDDLSTNFEAVTLGAKTLTTAQAA